MRDESNLRGGLSTGLLFTWRRLEREGDRGADKAMSALGMLAVGLRYSAGNLLERHRSVEDLLGTLAGRMRLGVHARQAHRVIVAARTESEASSDFLTWSTC
jgi:hypothetical protein